MTTDAKEPDSAEAAIAAITEQMRPQVDAALETTANASIDQCVGIVEACRMTGTDALGHMHTAGWNDALKFAAERLRNWKEEASR